MLAALVFAAATAVTGTYGPVAVTACSLANSHGIVKPNSLVIKYHNISPNQTLKAITFHVRYHGLVETFTDTGTYSPGAKISNTFNEFGGVAWAGAFPAACSVTAVTFANGQMMKI